MKCSREKWHTHTHTTRQLNGRLKHKMRNERGHTHRMGKQQKERKKLRAKTKTTSNIISLIRHGLVVFVSPSSSSIFLSVHIERGEHSSQLDIYYNLWHIITIIIINSIGPSAIFVCCCGVLCVQRILHMCDLFVHRSSRKMIQWNVPNDNFNYSLCAKFYDFFLLLAILSMCMVRHH